MNGQRHRRRRGTRGAALVEGAFMAMLFVIIWYAALYAHNLGATKAKINSDARAQAWNFAMANCDHGKGDNPTTPADWGATESPGPLRPVPGNPPSQPSTPGSDANAHVMNVISGLLGKLFVNPDGSRSLAEGTIRFRMPDYSGEFHDAPSNLQSEVVVFCNEMPENGDVLEVLKMIFGDLFHFSI